jgi:hypothetical protein
MIYSRHPVPNTRGVSRSSRTLGAGCGGRCGVARRAALKRTAKACGPGLPTLRLRSRDHLADDGGKKARSPGRARDKLLKPLRGECRMFSGASAVNTRAHTYYPPARTRLRVHWAPGIPRALLFSRGNVLAQLGRIAARSQSRIWMNVIARSARDEAIHRSSFAARWIASLALAMTWMGQLFEIRTGSFALWRATPGDFWEQRKDGRANRSCEAAEAGAPGRQSLNTITN